MSDQDETYCRLCAETTPIEQLISSEDDVAISSKVSTKMLWINVDVSSDTLPTTICFSCFDLLEKTWSFLHNVRTAQIKLSAIFEKKTNENHSSEDSNLKPVVRTEVGKPVNKDWEDFEMPKQEVKEECAVMLEGFATVDPKSLLEVNVKTEEQSDDDIYDSIEDSRYSSDSDQPLMTPKKKLKRELKNYDDLAMLQSSDFILTWEDYMCRCAQCDAQCKNIESLRLHSITIHSCCCIFKCTDCGKVCASYRSFINHVRVHKKTLRHCCDYCNNRFSSSSHLKKHMSNSHRHAYLTTCQNCGAVFESEELLQDHTAIYSKGPRKQRKREEQETDLKCDLCSKEFKSRSNLQQHKLVHTERNREFSCHVCGKMFFTKGTLSTHMLTHEDTKPHKCEFCPMAFRARGNLQSHISLHSGAKPFVCEQCGKSFRVKRHLKSHSIVHTDLMPFVCQYCNKTFRFKTRLNLHLRQHTGAKPYKCFFCQRDFTNGSNYKKHMIRRHNIDTSKKKYNNIVSKDEIANQA